MRERYLITGGAGFIGSHLAEALLAAGHDVTALDDLSTGRLENVHHLVGHAHFRLVRGSAVDRALVDALTGQCDGVFHLAAALGVQLVVDQPVRAICMTIHSTEVVLEAAARHGKPVLITSSSEVYGKGARIPFQEDDDVLIGATRQHRWCYAYSKGVGEFLALAYHHERGLPVTVVRLFNTVGPRQVGMYGMVLPRFVHAAVRGLPLHVYGDGAQTRCFCHVADVVRALVRLRAAPAANGEVFNVGGDEEVSVRELAERVVGVAGSASRIVRVDYASAYGRGFEDVPRRVPSLEKIRRAIGFTTTFNLNQIITSMVEDERARLQAAAREEARLGLRQSVPSLAGATTECDAASHAEGIAGAAR